MCCYTVVCIWKFEVEKFVSICKLNLKIHEEFMKIMQRFENLESEKLEARKKKNFENMKIS